MHPTEEFLKHATDCEAMAKSTRDPQAKATWKRMADRWRGCADVFTRDSLTSRHGQERHNSNSMSGLT